MGLKCFDVMRQTFGEDLVGAVMFGILSGAKSDNLRLKVDNKNSYRKIEAIKAIRCLSRLGLKEAKDLIEAAEWRSVDLKIEDGVYTGDQDYIEEQIANLKAAGVIVT